MKPSVKQTILDYLKRGDFVAGGTIEAYCAGLCRVKNSNVGRRLRELEVSGAIEAEYRKLQGVSNKVVFYRLKKPDVFQMMGLTKKPLTESLFKLKIR